MPARAAEPTEAQVLYWSPRVDLAKLPSSLIVEVGERIVQQNLSQEVAALVAPLGSYELRLNDLADAAQKELGGSVLSPTERDGSDDAAKFQSLWATFAPGSLFPAASTLGSADTLKMLDGQFFELILLRYFGTDGYIHAALPRTLHYRSKVDDYSPQDDFRKILAATEGDQALPTLSERVAGRELGFHSVSFLLHDVNSERMEAKVLSRPAIP